MSNTTNTIADHGILYTPSNGKWTPDFTIERLDSSSSIDTVRLQWVDLANTIRYRVIPKRHFKKILEESKRPSISLGNAVLGIVFISLADGFSASGEYLYVPDMASLRWCPYAPNQVVVMGWFQEKYPLRENPKLEIDICPRTILRRVVEEAKSKYGVEFLVGFETEFILLKSTSPTPVAVNSYGFSVSSALASGSVETVVLEEIAQGIQSSGIELQMYHAEAAPGQYEVVTGPLSPLEAADALIHTREIIYNTASKHGLRATLAPRVYMDNCGSAAHAHISIHSSAERTSDMSAHESSFLSSLLTHLPALPALTLPIPASYKRMVDGAWTGGTYACWGTENREAPIRLCNAQSSASRNFEFRTLDGTANPYLALAGILGVGAQGIRDQVELKVKDCSGEKTAAQMTEGERRELGIVDRLPLTWEEARVMFSGDEVVKNIFGQEFIDKYLSVNELLGRLLDGGKNPAEALSLLVEQF